MKEKGNGYRNITLPFLPEASYPPLKSMPPLIPVKQSMFFLQQIFKYIKGTKHTHKNTGHADDHACVCIFLKKNDLMKKIILNNTKRLIARKSSMGKRKVLARKDLIRISGAFNVQEN